MALAYRCAPLPPVWPGAATRTRTPSPFKVNWTSTLTALEREVRALKGRDVVLRLAVRDQDIRIDGGVKASARPSSPAVVLEFKSGPDLLSFPCDRFNWWEDNVRAIALALEALRKVDRYGVRSGRQYEGFKALPSGGAIAVAMTVDQAGARLQHLTDRAYHAETIVRDPAAAKQACRIAARICHPDTAGTGSTELFQEVMEIRRVLSAHFQVEL